MESDFFLVLRFWGTLFLVGAAAYPLTKRLFAGWYDRGYLFSKAIGMAMVTWIVYVVGTLRVVPFSKWSIGVPLGIIFLLGIGLQRGDRGSKGRKGAVLVIVAEELFFLAALLFWSWIKAHEPSIRGLEKFMDFGFMKSILESQYFPPRDMWYPPLPINYYYFGHMVTAVLTKLSGLDLAVTFNLMLASLFALTITMSFSIGRQIGAIGGIGRARGILGGMLTAFLVTLAGNMQTIYAFTSGYTGDNVQPFWELGWKIEKIGLLGAIWNGLNTYWYANATRFIPFTIHEFPSYSFVVSDVHGHVLSIPFVLLAIGLLIHMWGSKGDKESWGKFIFYGFLVGILLMTNALDGPIYLGLLMVVLGVSMYHRVGASMQGKWKELGVIIGVVLIAASLTSLPFLSHFTSFVSGIAVNCPPALLSNTKIGPVLFEGVEKCQKSPLWMMTLLWGFFWYCGVWLILRVRKIRGVGKIGGNKYTQIEQLLLIFFIFSLVLIFVPEFFYFKDIYPAHFRSNTMFKLGYEAYILFSIVAGYVIVSFITRKESKEDRGSWGRMFFVVFLIPQLFLVSIYPIFSVRSYFGGLRQYEGLDGLAWLARQYPSDYFAIQWLNQNAKCQMIHAKCERYALVEADGDSYTDYARMSVFTGIPTVIGWPVHEWLWRGTYDVVAPRREEVRQVYESDDIALTRTILDKYGVRYIIVGALERQKYPGLQEWKFGQLGEVVFQNGQTMMYQMK